MKCKELDIINPTTFIDEQLINKKKTLEKFKMIIVHT